MRDYCWSLAGRGLGCDPEKRQKKKTGHQKLCLNVNAGDLASFSLLSQNACTRYFSVGLFLNHTRSFLIDFLPSRQHLVFINFSSI